MIFSYEKIVIKCVKLGIFRFVSIKDFARVRL